MRGKKIQIGLAIATVAIVVIVLLWDWNWFKPIVEARASAALGRKVTLGHFDLRIFHKPAVLIDEAVVANPDAFPGGSEMASVHHLEVDFKWRPLFGGKIVLPEIIIDRPNADFERLASGDANWTMSTSKSGGAGASSTNSMPDIGALVITDGLVHYQDAVLKSNFISTVHTTAPATGSEGRIIVETKGTYGGKPITAYFAGGSVLTLRQSSRPYPIEFRAENGATAISINGTVLNPIAFSGANVLLDLKGNDLADLYPLTNIPFPSTPGYHLSGKLDYTDHKVRFRNFAGTVGSSDLEGTIAEDPGKERPLITANLTSKRILLADLGGFIGAAPGKAGAPNDTSTQKTERAKENASPKLLPDTPINLPKLRSADLDVTYVGQQIQGKSIPLDNLNAHLIVNDGALALKPLSFGVGTGQIMSNIALNGQRDLVHAVADIDFRRIDVSRIMQSTGIFKGVGTIGGHANIDALGNSLAQMMERGNGQLILLMKGGDISAILVDLAGLDFGNTLLSALGIPNRAPVRCMVTSFGLQQGVVDTKLFVIDTTEANILGKGTVDLRGNESIDYQLSTEPKHFSIGSFNAPIDVKGPLKSPGILPDPAVLAERGGAAVALGVLLTPLGALIPTIQLGLGEDNDCKELVQQASIVDQKLQSSSTAAQATGRKALPSARHRNVHKTLD